MGNPRRTIKQLKSEFSHDLLTYVSEFNNNLKATTPIRTGQARGGWQKLYAGGEISGRTKVIQNNVPYIGNLDQGTSRQAPRGIVNVAANRTRKP